MTTTIQKITVFWAVDIVTGEHWACRARFADGSQHTGSVAIGPGASLDDAIDQACHQLGVELTHDDFARTSDDGGCGDWAAMDEATQ